MLGTKGEKRTSAGSRLQGVASEPRIDKEEDGNNLLAHRSIFQTAYLWGSSRAAVRKRALRY